MNTVIVTENKLIDPLVSQVNWMYGTDSKTIGGVTMLDVSSLALTERTDTGKIQALLKDTLSAEFWAIQDEELTKLTIPAQ